MLDTLEARLQALRRRGPSLAVGVWGEAGIGKTYSVQGLLRALPFRNVSVAAARAVPDLARAFAPRAPDWAQRTLERVADGQDPDVPGAVEALAASVTAGAPLAVLLEDGHDATARQLDLLGQFVTAALRARGLALILTSRVPPPAPFEAQRLHPLSDAASARLLESEVGAPLPEEAAQFIYARAAGNPLFTLEYLRHLTRAGHLWNDGRRWRWRAPPTPNVPLTVEALIEQALQRAVASPAHARALGALALLGPQPPDTWARVADLSPQALRVTLEELHGFGVLQAGEAGDVAHPLYREVLRAGLSADERRTFARRAVAALHGDPPAAAAFVEAAQLDPEETFTLLQRAAADLRAQGNAVGAARLLARAVPVAPVEARGAMALEAAGQLISHDLPTTARLYELALQTPAADPAAVRAYAHLLARQGRAPDVEALLAPLPDALRARVNPVGLAVTMHNVAGQHAAALDLWEARQDALGGAQDPEVLRAVAASALATGRMALARALTGQALAVTREPLLRSEVLAIQAITHYHAGDHRAADATIQEVLALLAPLDQPRVFSTALLNRAAFLRAMGEYGAMAECLEEALRLRRQTGDGKAYAFAQAALAEVRIEQGAYEQAEDLLTEAIATLEVFGPSRFLINTYAMASQLYLAQGTPMGTLLAVKHAERALTDARATGSPRTVCEILFDASLASTRAGNAARGAALAREALDLTHAAGDSPADRLRSRWALALALDALGEAPEAITLLRAARDDARALEQPLEEQKLGLELDRLTGDRGSAQARLAWFEARGLLHGAQLVRRAFPALDAPRALTADPTVHLEVLGPVRASGRAVSGRKRRELLAVLLEARVAGRAEVTRLDLLDALYPEEDEGRAGASLKELIHALRQQLGAATIATTTAGYALGSGVTSDLEAFLQSADTRLWRGAYLGGEASATDSVRDAAFLALRRRLPELLTQDPLEAARAARLLLDAEPYDTEALALTLRALRAAQHHKTLGRVYAAARARLAEVGEALPEHWAAFLAAPPA